MRRLQNIFRLLLAAFFLKGSGGSWANEPDSRDSASPYGVLDFAAWDHGWNGHHEPLEKVKRSAQLMRAAGIGWVRMDFLWSDLEPQQGRFDFDRYDAIVSAFRENGICVLGILEYNPLWRPVPWNTAPDPEAYTTYARAVVHHFKDRVKYWEIWNEPDQATYWMPQDDMKTYAALLQKVYPVLKIEDPTCQVLSGSLSEGIPFKLRHLYKKAGTRCFDIVNIHPFVNPLADDALGQLHGIYTAVKNVMDEFGDGQKPIWFTELGCPGVRVPTRENGWWQGLSPTEDQQAAWVRTTYQDPLTWPGVQKIFWAFFRDTDRHFKNGVDSFGLVANDFTPKPAYDAYKAMTSAPQKNNN